MPPEGGENPGKRGGEGEVQRGRTGVEGVTSDTDAATRNLGEEVGEKTTESAGKDQEKPDPIADQLPDNQYKRAYLELRRQMKENPEISGPMTGFALALLALAAKYMKYMDYIPGKFVARLKDDSNLQKEKFSEEEIAKLKLERDFKREADAEARLKELVAAAIEKKELYGFEEASTKYVSLALFGTDSINDATRLGAKLVHTQDEDGVEYYKPRLRVDGDYTYGTVITYVRSNDLKSGDKIMAMATGNGKEVKYFNPKLGRVETVDMAQKNASSISGLKAIAFFVPIKDEEREETRAAIKRGEEHDRKDEEPTYGAGYEVLDKAREEAGKVDGNAANGFLGKLIMAKPKTADELETLQDEIIVWKPKLKGRLESLISWQGLLEAELKKTDLDPELKNKFANDLKSIKLLKRETRGMQRKIEEREKVLESKAE